MRLSKIKYDSMVLTIIIVPPTLSPLCLLEVSGVQLVQSDRGQFHYRRPAFSSQFKSKVGNILAKAEALRITLNIDGAPIVSR
jgi:hypothetical protein